MFVVNNKVISVCSLFFLVVLLLNKQKTAIYKLNAALVCSHKEQRVVQMQSGLFLSLFILMTVTLSLVINRNVCRCHCNGVILAPLPTYGGGSPHFL